MSVTLVQCIETIETIVTYFLFISPLLISGTGPYTQRLDSSTVQHQKMEDMSTKQTQFKLTAFKVVRNRPVVTKGFEYVG